MKIGIVTQYYRSINYGGNLQAYALCRFLEKNGIDAEQICYGPVTREKAREGEGRLAYILKHNTPATLLRRVGEILENKKERFLHREACRKFDGVMKERREKFRFFNGERIPNSGTVYSDEDISLCADRYDAFITGSDQVWNFRQFRKGYYLHFVPTGKKKLSYAASIAMPSLTEEQKSFFKRSLSDFCAVSVREPSAVSLIRDLSPVDVEVTADPTLLLGRSDWEDVCADRVIDGEYVFCYFLGPNPASRTVCRTYADAHGYRIVDLPMSKDNRRLMDDGFGDVEVNASPEEFLSLIRYAKYVFTDSFHATVFSQIFGTPYAVFKRRENDGMSARIEDITTLFGTGERYCRTKERESADYVESLPPISMEETPALTALLDRSGAFLLRNLT